MNKRGQFFLIAALIIIVVIFSVITVYNSVSYTKSDLPYAQDLANSIKEESVQIIDNGFFNNLPQTDIANNLNNLTLAYSKDNTGYNITYLSYNQGIYFANTFFNNNLYSLDQNNISIDPSESNITLSLNNIDHSFNLSKGYNIFIIVQKENNYEKFIATA